MRASQNYSPAALQTRGQTRHPRAHPGPIALVQSPWSNHRVTLTWVIHAYLARHRSHGCSACVHAVTGPFFCPLGRAFLRRTHSLKQCQAPRSCQPVLVARHSVHYRLICWCVLTECGKVGHSLLQGRVWFERTQATVLGHPGHSASVLVSSQSMAHGDRLPHEDPTVSTVHTST